MKKPLGELYSGEENHNLEAELTAAPEQVTEKIMDLRLKIQIVRHRMEEMRKVRADLLADLEITGKRIEAVKGPMVWGVALQKGEDELEKAVKDLENLENTKSKLELTVAKKIKILQGWEEKLKNLEEQLDEESRRKTIGEA